MRCADEGPNGTTPSVPLVDRTAKSIREPTMKITKDNANAMTPKLEMAVRKALNESGFEEYRVDVLKLTPMNMPLMPGHILRCTTIGNHVVCTYTSED
jgi:hypothetical protein